MNTFNFLITSQLNLSASVSAVDAMPGYSKFEMVETDDTKNKYNRRVVYSVVLETPQIDALLRSFSGLQQNEISKTQGRDSRS